MSHLDLFGMVRTIIDGRAMSDSGAQETGGEAMKAGVAPLHTAPARIKAILDELDRVAAEYAEAQRAWESARVHFKAARERFASIKRIASDMLAINDWYQWQEAHSNVRYAAMTVGEAIREALQVHTFSAAHEIADSDDPSPERFEPSLTLDQIANMLEAGGFEFKTAAARREVNAALMRLDGVKTLENGCYELEDAAEILQFFMTPNGETDEVAPEGEPEKEPEMKW